MSAYHHYLCFVVKQHFGPHVQQLVATLLTHGPLTLPALIHYSSLSPTLVRKALTICIQHNVVVADYEPCHTPEQLSSAPPSSAPSPTSAQSPASTDAQQGAAVNVRVLYRVYDAALRCRPRYTGYVESALQRHGEDAALLVQSLCTKGILTTSQLLDHALALYQQQQLSSSLASSPATSSSSTPPIAEKKREQLEAALAALSAARYVKRAIMAKASTASTSDDSEEKEFLSSAELRKRKREEERKAKAAAKDVSAKPKTRSRRKKDAEDDERLQREEAAALQEQKDADADAEAARQQQLPGIPDHWTLDERTFTIDTQRDALLRYARDRLSPTSAFVLAALLRIHPLESIRLPVYEEDRIMDAVTAYAATHPNPPRITPSALHTTLTELSLDPSRLLSPKGPTSYALDMAAFLSHLQLLQAQSILSARYSVLAARIYRVLLMHSRLEESQLAELCTASRQSVRETLHELMKEEWVVLSEVPRTVDRAPSKTFFLWGVDQRKVKARVRELMHVSAVKGMEREGKEREDVEAVMGKVDMQQRIGEKERAKVDRWKIAHERLELAQKRVQDTLAIWE